MPEIVVIGSLNMDLVFRAPRMPSAGETLRGEAFSTIPGGKGANQAAAAARLGGRVAMVGCVGEDGFGERLVDTLAGFGVDVSPVRPLPGTATGVAAILVDEAGDNRIVVVPGANGCLAPEDLATLDDRIGRAGLLVLQLEVPLETVEAAVRLASRDGVPVLLNPAPAVPLPDDLLRRVDWLVLNETEAKALAGIEPVDDPTCRAAAQALRARGAGGVVLTLGARGAYLLTAEGGVHVPARPVAVVDTTAAGDAFVGGLAVSLTEGRPPTDAARFACAAGTLAVTRPGAQISLPCREDVETLLAQGEGTRRASGGARHPGVSGPRRQTQ